MNFAVDDNINNFQKGFLATPQGGYEDPTYLGFRLVFDFNPVHRDLSTGITEDPLFAINDDLESAQRYLKAIGYSQRAEMLKEFKSILQYINEKTPWYWQTLDGLSDVWKIEMGEPFDPYRGKDKVLTIACNESIDLRVTGLADLYRKATFDPQNMRSLLPENLKFFTLKVQLMEMRKFHKLKNASRDLPVETFIGNANLNNIGSDYREKFEMVNDLISMMEFSFAHCEFDFNDSFPLTDAVNMGPDMVMASQRFKIKVRHIKETHSYKLLDLVLGEGPYENNFKGSSGALSGSSTASTNDNSKRIPDFDDALNKANETNKNKNAFGGFGSEIRRQLENIGANLTARGVNRINEAITSKVLGNVYDLRNQSFETIINQFLGRNQSQNINPLGKEDVYPNVPGSDLSTNTNTKVIGNIYRP